MSAQKEKVSRIAMFRKLPNEEKVTKGKLEDGRACVKMS